MALRINAALPPIFLGFLFLLGSQGFPSASARAQSAPITITSFVMTKHVCASRQAALSALYSSDGNARGVPADCINECSDAGDIYLVALFYAGYNENSSSWPRYTLDNPAALKGMCGEKVTVTGHVTRSVPDGHGELYFYVDALNGHVKAGK
jgi:hypothetical protein